MGPLEGLRQTFSLSWRTLVQIKHNPAELIDFSIQPVMFLLLFTYVFGGAIGGSFGLVLVCTLAAPVGGAVAGLAEHGPGLVRDPFFRAAERGGEFPSLPVMADGGGVLAPPACQHGQAAERDRLAPPFPERGQDAGPGQEIRFRLGMLPAQVERGMRAKDPGYRAHPRMRVTGRVVEDRGAAAPAGA